MFIDYPSYKLFFKTGLLYDFASGPTAFPAVPDGIDLPLAPAYLLFLIFYNFLC